MADYDFVASLSPLDFELLSKDLLEAELDIQLENFSEGRDKGIDLRYAPQCGAKHRVFNMARMAIEQVQPKLIVQCKRYTKFSDLKATLKRQELAKIQILRPARYVLTTSVSLSPQQSDEVKDILFPFVQSTGDIYGRERLNSLLAKHPEVERRHIKLWAASAGVLDSIINAGTYQVSHEEVELTLAAAKIYVKNTSFDEALTILKKGRVCIISGLPGIGKTTLARMLLLYFYKKQFDVVKITGDIAEARVGSHNKPRFYYYDDFLGQTAQADKLNKNEDQRLLDFMAGVRDSKESVFVLTTREYILNQARLHYEKLARAKFDHQTCVIDLSKYSRRIRAQILYNHLHFSKLPRAHLEALVADRSYIKIVDHPNYNPRLIEYLTDSAWIGDIPPNEYPARFLRKLDNPVEIWDHAFRNQLSDKARHLLFVLTTLPRECLLSDLEHAFKAFHLPQCERFGIARSTTDFNSALKELDGTFVSTTRIRESVLARFQNPSIRDFMQNLLFGGESLKEILGSLVFFEQPSWLAETLLEDRPHVSGMHLSSYFDDIVSALETLIDSPSCSISVAGSGTSQRITLLKCNPARRLAVYATSVEGKASTRRDAFVDARIGTLTGLFKDRTISASSCINEIEQLQALGRLEKTRGKQLLKILKAASIGQLADLDDFATVARVLETMPHLFSSEEVKEIRNTYASFAEEHAEGCVNGSYGIDDPESLRDEALRIGAIADLLGVAPEGAQKRIKDRAKKLEEEIEDHREWDDDDRGGSGAIEECPDRDIDSMFGTLGN